MHAVHIVKHAIVSGLGNNLVENWQKLLSGRSAIDNVNRFEVDRLGSQKASCTKHLPIQGENRVCALMREVIAQVKPVPPGTNIVWAGIKGDAEYIEAGRKNDIFYLPDHYRKWVAEILGIANRGFDINAACASSTVGMAIGALKIARGESPAVLICAADVVTSFVFRGFSALRALTPTECRP
jgi:3-oxoacyl-[acyl-carrier-protein] synthase II